jgi:hypothetical protein
VRPFRSVSRVGCGPGSLVPSLAVVPGRSGWVRQRLRGGLLPGAVPRLAFSGAGHMERKTGPVHQMGERPRCAEDGIRTRDPHLCKVVVSVSVLDVTLPSCCSVRAVSTQSTDSVPVVERSTMPTPKDSRVLVPSGISPDECPAVAP